jgi:hypothetical protein
MPYRIRSASLLILFALGCGSSSKDGFDNSSDDAATTADGTLDVDSSPGDLLDATLGTDTGQKDASGPSDGSIFNDGAPDVVTTGDACVTLDGGPPPYAQRCTAGTNDECDGTTDTILTSLGVAATLLNGATGNGFDDDCDGLVDEGCSCPGNGQTKDCYLVPASQASATTKTPVGWCTENSKGSLDCAGAEFPKWSGTCRGAQPPYRHDVCAQGDFNCDGVQENSDVQDCACKIEVVECPTTPVTLAPYPDPKNLALLDGSQWITAANQRANATNWTWTIIGGDCDNVLPHPTFALYNGKDTTVANSRKGTRTPVKFDTTLNPQRYVATTGQPLVSIQAVNYGSGVAGGQIYPAFGLSGDYVVQGEWDLGGTHYVCTQKVQVRAPGVRAELCWDTVGGDPPNFFSPAPNGNDIDLHLARLQGVSACTANGWNATCLAGSGNGSYQDCFYHPLSGCPDPGNTGVTSAPNWGYAKSADSACLGWGSKRTTAGDCTNPRLDLDNVTCDPTVEDPTEVGSLFFNGPFCSPENINLDNPNDNDTFVVGVNHYDNHPGTSTTNPSAKPHVNVYCNGVRVLSAGYNPVAGQTSFPVLTKPGQDSAGDFWTVATVKAHVTGGQITACDVATIPAHHADPTRDGTPAQPPPNDTIGVCVDSTQNATPAPNQYNYVDHRFIDHAALQGGANGGTPANPQGWCKH